MESTKTETLNKYNKLIEGYMSKKDWVMVAHYRELKERLLLSDHKKKLSKERKQERSFSSKG